MDSDNIKMSFLVRRKNRSKIGLQRLLFFCSKNLQFIKDFKSPEIGTFEDNLNFIEDEENRTF